MRRKRQVKERKFACLSELTCPVCGKTFIAAPQHAYKDKRHQTKKVCSWHCVCESERLKDAAAQARALKAKAKKGGAPIES